MHSKLTEKQLRSLFLWHPSHHVENGTLDAITPDLLKDLAEADLRSLEWPVELPAYIAEFLYSRHNKDKATVDHVLLAGVLLRYIDLQTNQEDNPVKRKLADIISESKFPLYALYTAPIEDYRFADGPGKVLIANMRHIYVQAERMQRRLNKKVKFSTPNDNNINISISDRRGTLSQYQRCIRKFQEDLYYLLNKLAVDHNIFRSTNPAIMVDFLLAYPSWKSWNQDLITLALHILPQLVNKIEDDAQTNKYLHLALEFLKYKDFLRHKANDSIYAQKLLIESVANYGNDQLKSTFRQLLQPDLQNNWQAYPKEVKELLYKHELALRECDHLNRQCIAYLTYLNPNNARMKQVIVDSETLNFLWPNADANTTDIMMQIACTNFADMNSSLEPNISHKMNDLIRRLSIRTMANKHDRQIQIESATETGAQERGIAHMVQDLLSKAWWNSWRNSEPVRIKIVGFIKGIDPLTPIVASTIFISIRYTNSKYYLYNATCTNDLSVEGNKEADFNTLAKHILKSCYDAQDPATKYAKLAKLRFTTYTGYEKRESIFFTRSLTPTLSLREMSEVDKLDIRSNSSPSSPTLFTYGNNDREVTPVLTSATILKPRSWAEKKDYPDLLTLREIRPLLPRRLHPSTSG